MEGLTGSLEQYMSSSPLLAIPIALAAGVLISFTPCVYPVLGPTVAFVGARAAGSRRRAFSLSLVYGLGMALMYAGLGAFAALSGRMFGQITANPYAQGLIGAVCLLMGLSMLDVFIIELPSSFQGLYAKRFGGGHVHALAAGAVFALIPASCAAPVLLVILAFVAAGQNLLYGITLLFAFGIGVSVLVVLAGTFAGLLTALPTSGQWMEKIKHGMGWVMVALGAYFFFYAGRLSYGTAAVTPLPQPIVAQTPDQGAEPPVAPRPAAEVGDQEGMAAPDFTLPAPDGTPVSLSEYRGKVVFLTFWASWCVACIEEMPELRRLYDEYHDQGFEVIGINATDNAAVVAAIAQQKRIPYMLLVAAGSPELGEKYTVLGLPLNLLIDRSGVIVYRGGMIPEDIDEQITAALTRDASAREAATEPEPRVGDETGMIAPDFTLPTPAGVEVSLSDYRGNVVLLTFWASYDGKSMDEVPTLRRVHAEYHDSGLEIIGVNVGDPTDDVDDTAKRKGLRYTLLVGIDSSELSEKYDTLDMPRFFLIDRSGVIAHQGDTIPDDIEQRIVELLHADTS